MGGGCQATLKNEIKKLRMDIGSFTSSNHPPCSNHSNVIVRLILLNTANEVLQQASELCVSIIDGQINVSKYEIEEMRPSRANPYIDF